jgi:mRNA-degrading endonuclease toxin of MazEF toxin-antitoxin module
VKAAQRGEVWLVDLGLAAKVRPALSVPAEDVDRALVTIVPTRRALAALGSRHRSQCHSCVPEYSTPRTS